MEFLKEFLGKDNFEKKRSADNKINWKIFQHIKAEVKNNDYVCCFIGSRSLKKNMLTT